MFSICIKSQQTCNYTIKLLQLILEKKLENLLNAIKPKTKHNNTNNNNNKSFKFGLHVFFFSLILFWWNLFIIFTAVCKKKT